MFNKQLFLYARIALAAMSATLCGCYASGHGFYDAYVHSEPSESCRVIWVRNHDAAQHRLDMLPRVEFIGQSSFETENEYNVPAAESDCKKAGGDYIIVVSEGITAITNRQVTVRGYDTHRTHSRTTYSDIHGHHGGYNTSTSYSIPHCHTYDAETAWHGFRYYVYRRVQQ